MLKSGAADENEDLIVIPLSDVYLDAELESEIKLSKRVQELARQNSWAMTRN